MMKPFIFFVLCLFCLRSMAQQYQSIFGAISTKWTVARLGIDLTISDSIFYEKDTVIANATWKKVKGQTGCFTSGVFREDLQTGRVWYKSLGSDTSTTLLFDFSLQKGDTFNLTNPRNSYTTLQKTVDTNFVENGRRVVVFKGSVDNQLSEKIRFIEGVGSNLSPLYKDGGCPVFKLYMLCAFKDGVQVFANQLFNGQCYVLGTAINAVPNDRGISVYPLPFRSELFINNSGSDKLVQITLYASDGSCLLRTRYAGKLTLPSLPGGLYYLRIDAEKGRSYTKAILHY